MHSKREKLENQEPEGRNRASSLVSYHLQNRDLPMPVVDQLEYERVLVDVLGLGSGSS